MVQQRGEREDDEKGGAGSAPGPASPVPAASSVPLPPSRLAVSLRGQLPCVQCGYELQGVSILGVCPECGTAVRATLLAVVDPLAMELRPIDRPRRVALGLLMWVGGLFAAALVVGAGLVNHLLASWSLGASGAGGGAGGSVNVLHWLQVLALPPLVLLAGVGAALMARPHDQVHKRETLMARLGALLHAPLAVIVVFLSDLHGAGVRGGGVGSVSIGALASLWEPAPDRSGLRLAAGAVGLGIIVLMRPVARVLVARSLAIRTGRVDRQTLLATGAAVVVVMVGDGLGLVGKLVGGAAADWLLLGGVTVLGFGALLLFIGLLSSLVDAVRIARAIVRPGPSMHQVVHGPEGEESKGRRP